MKTQSPPQSVGSDVARQTASNTERATHGRAGNGAGAVNPFSGRSGAMGEKLKVGDVLWYRSNYGSPWSVTVTKVGRAWAETDYRVMLAVSPDKSGAHAAKGVRGYSSDGDAWRSEAAYRASLRPGELRAAIHKRTEVWGQEPLTLEQLEAAALALGIEVER